MCVCLKKIEVVANIELNCSWIQPVTPKSVRSFLVMKGNIFFVMFPPTASSSGEAASVMWDPQSTHSVD